VTAKQVVTQRRLASRRANGIFPAVPRSWTTEQAVSLAPDPAALKTAQGLATSRKWNLLGRDEEFVWGLAQGSGAQPYQVQIDLAEPAFKCSCPSRKFPCKHGLGLLLLFAGQPGSLTTGAKPDWVAEWAAKRAQKATKQETKAAESVAAPPDPAAQARRREKRAANMAEGVEFLQGWLHDLARQGLSAAAPAGYGFWDTPARRLVDAQAPGLARRVRLLGGLVGNTAANEEQTVAELGRLHLLLTASGQREKLPRVWQEEIDGQLGWAIDQDELRQREGVAGRWLVGAQTVREEEKLITRTSYLFSTDGRAGKLLEFAHASQPAVATLALGRWFEGEVVYFPGVKTLRVLLKTPPRDADAADLRPLEYCDDVLAAHTAQVAENPLADELTMVVRLVPQRDGERWWLRDASGATLPIAPGFMLGWELLACAGGRAVDVAGTWDGFGFLPLSVIAPHTVWDLAPRRD
jgi:hypothetical protein